MILRVPVSGTLSVSRDSLTFTGPSPATLALAFITGAKQTILFACCSRKYSINMCCAVSRCYGYLTRPQTPLLHHFAALLKRYVPAPCQSLGHQRLHSSVPGQSQPVRMSSGIQKAKGQPIICVKAQGSAVVFKLASIEDRDTLLTVLNPLKDAATKAKVLPGPRSIPTAEVQAAVFAANPNLRDMHQRCALPACTANAMLMSLFSWHFDFGGVARPAWVCKTLLHISQSICQQSLVYQAVSWR